MMKSAKDRLSSDLAKPLNRAKKRRILAQRKMSPDSVVVGGVGLEDLPQMGLAEDHDVIQAL
jgi:hypothetical protein